MSAYVIAAIFAGGGTVLGALVMYGLYAAGWLGGAAAERQKIEAASAAKMQRQNEVLQKEISDADLDKSLKDGSF